MPVFPGASQPLLRALRTAEFVCGADGLEGAALPPPRIAPQDRHAVTFPDRYAASGGRSGPVTLCPLGPLTNIALAFAQEPALAAKVERIVLMGGARDLGNVTPAAEFNFFVDPHAAAHRPAAARADRHVRPARDASGDGNAGARRQDRGARHAGRARRSRNAAAGRGRGGIDRFGVPGHPLHDPCVIAYLLWPDLFAGRDCHVAVETASEATIGRSIDRLVGIAEAETERPCDRPRRRRRLLRATDRVAGRSFDEDSNDTSRG